MTTHAKGSSKDPLKDPVKDSVKPTSPKPAPPAPPKPPAKDERNGKDIGGGKAVLTIPNRLLKVDEICKAHPEAFPQDDGNDAARLNLLKTQIIPQLNKIDGGRWGYMTKTNQGGKVPCDVLMWKPNNGVVDCMTGTGATWIEHDPPPENLGWYWTAVPETDEGEEGGAGGETPTPIPPPAGVIPYDEARSIQFGQACNMAYAESGMPIDPGMIAVHAERDAYDHYAAGMPDPECIKKHVNEFRAVYGLPPI